MQAFVSNKRRIQLMILLLLAVVLGAIVLTAPSMAQEAAKAGNDGTAEATKPVSFITWVVRTSGPIGAFIFMLSVYFGAVVVKSLIEIRLPVAAPPEVIAGCEKLIAERKPKDLVTLLQSDASFFSQILLAGISELKFGLEEAREKLDRKAETLTGKMERGISILAVLGTLGPMIGLLGTLTGMIRSFSQIAIGGVAMDAGKVAEGISEALVLTFEGVFLSVPSIYFYSLFRNRISVISLETTMLADDQLRATSRLFKFKGPPTSESVSE